MCVHANNQTMYVHIYAYQSIYTNVCDAQCAPHTVRIYINHHKCKLYVIFYIRMMCSSKSHNKIRQ